MYNLMAKKKLKSWTSTKPAKDLRPAVGDIRIAELAAWLVTSQSAPKDGVFSLRFSSQSTKLARGRNITENKSYLTRGKEKQENSYLARGRDNENKTEKFQYHKGKKKNRNSYLPRAK